MYWENGIFIVDLNDLTRTDDGPAIMSKENCRQLISRGKILRLRRGGGLDSGVLIDYASLPDRFKVKFIAKYGDPELRKIQEKMEYRIDHKAREWYFDDSRGIPSGLAERYTANASVLRMLSGKKMRMAASRATSGGGGIAWDAILEESERLREISGHTLPRSAARLAEWIRRFDAEGYGCLVSRKLGNTNSRTITDDMGRMIIALKRSKNPVYSVEMIRKAVNAAAQERGWKQIKSKASIMNYLNENVALWMDTEVGATKAKMLLNRMHSTILPTMPNARWEGDGTKVNLYYRTYVDGKEKMATFWVYEFIDVASEVMLGRCFSQGEDFDTFYNAFRSAVEKAGVFPYELVNDNQSSATTKQAQEWLSRCAQVARTTAPHNGPSKTIESIFGRFQGEVLARHWNFTGQNITAKRDSSRADIDFILQNIAGLPNYQECVAMYEADVQAWNTSLHPDQARYPGMTRMDVYQRESCPDCAAVTDASRADAFWIMSRDAVAYTNSGLKVTIKGQTFLFEVQGADGYPDLDWLDSHNGGRFFYRYDPQDISRVKLYSFEPKTGYTYVATALPKERIHRDIWSQTKEDGGFIREMEERVKEHAVQRHLKVKDIEREFGVAPEQHGLRSPLVVGVTRTEYDRMAARQEAEKEPEPAPEEVYPSTVGQVRKRVSGLDAEALRNL
ncbi:MAG: DDE-type integrase/transposase/recombinase [Bacteroidales bacterium]|nr:DDE-type integrase/transposase/recombinase [Bacteroidales bacterium]